MDLIRALLLETEALPDTRGHSVSVEGHGPAEVW